MLIIITPSRPRKQASADDSSGCTGGTLRAPQALMDYPLIAQHGVIGDRRTAALVAADGTLAWLCLPNYDGDTVFGRLLDAVRGGYWRFGPADQLMGRQQYFNESAALITTWQGDRWELELTDLMAWPQDHRPPGTEDRRVVVRRLRCLRGEVEAVLRIEPRYNFEQAATVEAAPGGLMIDAGPFSLGCWASCPLTSDGSHAEATLRLREGDTVWAVLALDEAPDRWTIARAQYTFDVTLTAWEQWQRILTYTGPRAEQVRRSALAVHLLSYAPTGSLVAAPTTSLPERIGGDLNYDYRYAWIRDASLSLAMLSLVGDTQAGQRYLDWLAALGSTTGQPLQVVYRVDGGTDLEEHEHWDIAGYRGSRPVRTGNRAFKQQQLDGFGFVGECVLVYLEHGGLWKDAYWELIRRVADYTAANWQQPDSGIWELPHTDHWVSSKVMSWVTLRRAVDIAALVGRAAETYHWRTTMDVIFAEVMERGWSDQLGSFRQRYDANTLDASALLIPVMGFLPADHPRVVATVDRIVATLTTDGFVYRFVPSEIPGYGDWAVGEFEGAFLPCTFWLATTYAKQGHTDKAEAILARAEAIAGDLGLFAEEVDVRSRTFLGNSPLLWAQMEYVQAIVELAKARPLSLARYLVGATKIQLQRLLGRGKPRDHTRTA